jgi:hypothetical protein
MPEHCICPNLDPMEQDRRLLWPLSGKALEDSTSLQFQALEWIANTDTHGAMVSSQVIQERYAATLLYFAFRGKSWHDRSSFLSNGNVGQWNTENAGIQCNESNQVTSIRLCKSLMERCRFWFPCLSLQYSHSRPYLLNCIMQQTITYKARFLPRLKSFQASAY